MFQTARNVCTGRKEKEESITLARNIAVANGYESLASRSRFREKASIVECWSSERRVTFSLPFISDQISIAAKQCLKRTGLEDSVTLIEIPPNTLRQRLVRNRIYGRLCGHQAVKFVLTEETVIA